MQNNRKGINTGGNFISLRAIFFLSLLFYSVQLQSQTKTNLEVFYNLVDSAAVNAAKYIPQNEKNVKLDLGAGNIYSIFNNRIMESFQKAGKNVLTEPRNDTTVSDVSFRIDKTTVNYGELFQEKLFGDFYAHREISLSGNYLLFLPGISSHNFNYSYTDTININEVKNIENIAFPFTQGKIPPEPFLSSIYEPVIAVGAAALTVILFFTIRSK
jgi:hypothetical protein